MSWARKVINLWRYWRWTDCRHPDWVAGPLGARCRDCGAMR